ncbi:MAG: phosphatase PAP2 family protein [Telluria sp.]
MHTRLAIVSAAVFLFLAALVTAGATVPVDAAVAQWCEAHRSGAATALLFAVTQWHATLGTLLMLAVLAGWFWKRGARAWARFAALAIAGGMLLNVTLKYGFERTRPQFAEPLVHLHTYSFPSGHANQATLLYGVLAAWLCARYPRRRAPILLGATLMVLLVAASRVYLGAHYLTDVLAGMAEGVTWLTICKRWTANARLPECGAASPSS